MLSVLFYSFQRANRRLIVCASTVADLSLVTGDTNICRYPAWSPFLVPHEMQTGGPLKTSNLESIHPYSSALLCCINTLTIIVVVAAAAAAKSLQSCPTLCNSVDGSPPGSPVPGILQARTLEWGAIAFSNRSGKWLLILFHLFTGTTT